MRFSSLPLFESGLKQGTITPDMPIDDDQFDSPLGPGPDEDRTYGTATATLVRPKAASKPVEDEEDTPKRWHVVLLDDDHHSYEYVILMMMDLFAMPPERAFQIAQTVDKHSRAICITTHKEHAELKQEQIHAYGRDALIASCEGSMSAVLVPEGSAEGNQQ